MKPTRILFLPVFFLSISLNISAQNCGTGFLGTKTLYSKPANKPTANPVGYVPVFINYVGRHGARHLTKDVKTNFAYQLLFQADSLQALTAKGQELMRMVLKLEKLENGNTKSISAEGRAELQAIGERMVQHNPNVFKQPVSLKVLVTKEKRTEQSADAFFTGINSLLKNKPEISRTTDDTNLRFYDFSPAYDAFNESDAIAKSIQSLQKTEQIDLIDKAFSERIFKDPFVQKLSPKQTEKFAAEVFGFATIVYSLQTEIKQAGFQAEDLNFTQFFSCEELAHLGLVDAAEDYLKKGPGTDIKGIQIKIAVPLLINFIKTTDEFITGGNYNAQLRFAHAETILPFAALLNISTADKTVSDLSKLNQYWQPENIAPLSSNIQWILYQKKGNENYLVKVLLNEKEVHITGLKTNNFPFYNWNDLKAFYLKKLSDWNIKPDADMNLYLKRLAVN